MYVCVRQTDFPMLPFDFPSQLHDVILLPYALGVCLRHHRISTLALCDTAFACGLSCHNALVTVEVCAALLSSRHIVKWAVKLHRVRDTCEYVYIHIYIYIF